MKPTGILIEFAVLIEINSNRFWTLGTLMSITSGKNYFEYYKKIYQDYFCFLNSSVILGNRVRVMICKKNEFGT